MQTIDSELKSRIYGHGRGSVFTPNDFLDLGGRDAVDKALSRLATRGEVRRLARGLYEYPREHPELGTLSPDIEKVAKALAGKDRLRLQPAGAYATNLLGLSEQVPAKAVFLTDGPSRRCWKDCHIPTNMSFRAKNERTFDRREGAFRPGEERSRNQRFPLPRLASYGCHENGKSWS